MRKRGIEDGTKKRVEIEKESRSWEEIEERNEMLGKVLKWGREVASRNGYID